MSISNQVMSKPVANLATLNSDENTFRVLQQTLYPGSTDEEVAMILGYCKARRIDPILKPVHLVPMSVKTGKKDGDGKDVYERKNVIMPGIALYRIDASRSGQYAGMSEPEFGEEITEEFNTDKKKSKVTYPKWCKVTVKKLLPNGEIAEFTAKEYWRENYATKSKWDNSPNDMWEKRAYGQLAKCAEAQALRKAFPDVVGNEYTKEEMEGKLHAHDEPRPSQTKNDARTFEGEKIDAQLLEDFEDFKLSLKKSENENQLKTVFNEILKSSLRKHPDLMKQLIELKDARKGEIMVADFNKEMDDEKVDLETGEVK